MRRQLPEAQEPDRTLTSPAAGPSLSPISIQGPFHGCVPSLPANEEDLNSSRTVIGVAADAAADIERSSAAVSTATRRGLLISGLEEGVALRGVRLHGMAVIGTFLARGIEIGR